MGSTDAAEPRRRLFESVYGHDRAPDALSPGVRAHYDRHLVRHLPADPAAAILDVGCGQGGLVAHLRDRGRTHVSGIDASAGQVAIAERLGVRGVSHAAAAEHLEAHPGAYDAILAVDVLEHLERAELLRVLDAIHAALRPGGRLVLQAPNGDGPFAGRHLYSDMTHERAFTARSIEQALRACGFSSVTVYPVDPAVHGARSAARWALWRAIRLALVGYLAVEAGVVRGHVLSQNLVAVADR